MAAGKRRVVQMALAAVAVLLIIVGGVFWARNRHRAEMATITIDLRDHSVTRGENSAETSEAPVELSRRTRHLTVDLPIGSKEGIYELALLGSADNEVRSATGMAQLQDHTVVLKTDMDLRGVSPGLYALGVRQSGSEWNRYPVQVK